MKTLQTILKNKTGILMGFVLAMMLAVSGLLSVRNSSSQMAAAAIVERGNQPIENVDSAAVDAKVAAVDAKAADSAAVVVENRMTEEAEKAAAATKKIGSGEASYYGRGFAGRPTANGERFNPAEMTAAHRTLPFGSKVRVTNTKNGRSVVVRVNDRGPYAHNRVIDLSRGAAERIGMVQSGTANVKLELIS